MRASTEILLAMVVDKGAVQRTRLGYNHTSRTEVTTVFHVIIINDSHIVTVFKICTYFVCAVTSKSDYNDDLVNNAPVLCSQNSTSDMLTTSSATAGYLSRQ